MPPRTGTPGAYIRSVDWRSGERWRARGRELKRRVWRWDADKGWAIAAIVVGSVPVALLGLIFEPGDSDRVGSAILLGIGLATLVGVLAYLDRCIDEAERRSHSSPNTHACVHGNAVRKARFAKRLRGYDEVEVDQALAALADSIDHGVTPTKAHISAITFHQRMRGYDPDEVDAFLDSVADTSPE